MRRSVRAWFDHQPAGSPPSGSVCLRRCDAVRVIVRRGRCGGTLSSLAMAADSGAGQLQNDLDVADTRVAVTGELDLDRARVAGAVAVLMSKTAHEITIEL